MATPFASIAVAWTLFGIAHGHSFKVSAGTLNYDHAATISIDGIAYLNDHYTLVAPNGTHVRIVGGNRTVDKVTPVPDMVAVGSVIVATPGCGATPMQMGVFFFPHN